MQVMLNITTFLFIILIFHNGVLSQPSVIQESLTVKLQPLKIQIHEVHSQAMDVYSVIDNIVSEHNPELKRLLKDFLTEKRHSQYVSDNDISAGEKLISLFDDATRHTTTQEVQNFMRKKIW